MDTTHSDEGTGCGDEGDCLLCLSPTSGHPFPGYYDTISLVMWKGRTEVTACTWAHTVGRWAVLEC